MVTSDSDVNGTGLISPTGETLIPGEAAIIRDLGNSEEDSSRYLLVIYATDETKDEDEAFFYTHDGIFSFGPEEDDKLYKGYAKIYDTQTQDFVPDVKVTNSNKYATNACGDSLLLTENGKTELISSDGEVIKTLERVNDTDIAHGYFLTEIDECDCIMDEEGNITFATEYTLDILDAETPIFTARDYSTDTEYVIDAKGGLYLKLDKSSAYGYCNGVVRVNNDDDSESLLKLDGSEIASGESFVNTDVGFWYSEGKDDTETLYDANGLVAENLEGYAVSMLFGKDESDGSASVYIINDKDYTLSFDSSCNISDCFTGAITVYSEGKYSIYDTFTGEQIIKGEFDDIKFVEPDILFVKADDTWTSYRVSYEY